MSTEQELKELMNLVQDIKDYGCPQDYAAFESRLRALLAELEAAREDAARYRWLRAQPNDCTAPRIDICHWTCDEGDSVNNGEGLRLEAADKAIDAARKGEA